MSLIICLGTDMAFMWKYFTDLFDYLPLTALIEHQVKLPFEYIADVGHLNNNIK